MAYFPKVDAVNITPMDQVQNNALRNQALQLQNAAALRDQNALAAYTQALNSGGTDDNAINAMRSAGDPITAGKLANNALTYRTNQAALARDMDQFIATRVPLAKDQSGWDAIMQEASARYGVQIPDSLRTYSPDLQKTLMLGGLSAAQRLANQKEENTAKALNLPDGVDVNKYASGYHNILSAGQEKLMFPLRVDQIKANIANTQSEMAKRDEMYPLQKQNLQSEIDARQTKTPRIIMFPDPNDELGKISGTPRKVPGYYDASTNSIVPLQVGAQGEMGGAPQQPGQGSFSIGGNQPGMIQQGNIDLSTRPKVKNADGSISTVRSMSFNVDGKEVLVPTVSDDGRIMSDQEAFDTYRRTGKHLGIFDSPQSATAYAQALHQQQEKMYVGTQQGQQSQQPSFKSADDVKAAYKAGKINRDQAVGILRQQFGMQ